MACVTGGAVDGGVDGGVVAGLSVGAASILYHYGRSLGGVDPPADAALLWAYDPETRQVQLANDTVTCLDLFDVNSGGGREALRATSAHLL